MSLLKKINVFRRKATKMLTSGIGKNNKINKPFDSNTKIKRILVSRPNHRLGNQLLVTPLLQELETLFPESKIDLFVKGGVSHEIFKNYSQVDQIISLPKKHFKELGSYLKAWFNLKRKKYDLAINVVKGSSSGRISVKVANATYKFYGEEFENTSPSKDDFNHIAKQPVYNLRAELDRMGFKTVRTEVPSLNLKLNEDEIAKGKLHLEKIYNNNLKTVSLFTYATGDKCYSKEWWDVFYKDLKNNLPEVNFVEILPVENISQLNFSIPSYYSKEIRDIAGVIANTSVFIGADSGMMHLATASGTPTLGLFSITNPVTYEPYGKMNRGINTNHVSNLEIIEMVKTILNSNL
ncbi:glycosyltransferase family 9 protein [Flavobacterium sp. HXWNR69]|uniref:Glycosyltransferase family 9 protein n=1 Tax=Flavobacterium fragile TaxID=2949085 RepID=A0ABT0TDR8_9FLAO|nr:glycosyltransferase family 9 protein [Flavobacterium sp. HXWNR69]MCL9769029.1 glycosyltransferase family 9 protein [Flavobacterium sp. HXWNR69]